MVHVISGLIRIEEYFGGEEPFSGEMDDLSIGESVVQIIGGGIVDETEILSEIGGTEAYFFLDLSDGFEICGGVEVVASELEELDEMLGDMSAGDVHPLYLVFHDLPLDHGHTVTHSVPTVQ